MAQSISRPIMVLSNCRNPETVKEDELDMAKEVEIDTATLFVNDAIEEEQMLIKMVKSHMKPNHQNVIENWNYIIENIDPIPLLDQLDSHNILEKAKFSNFRSKRRIHQASLVLAAVCRKIQQNEDIFSTFQDILSKISLPCANALKISSKEIVPEELDETQIETNTEIMCKHRGQIDKLLRHDKDLLEIVGNFIESSIFNLDDGDSIFSTYPGDEARRHFVDVVLKRIKNGSFRCLSKNLKQTEKFEQIFKVTDVQMQTISTVTQSKTEYSLDSKRAIDGEMKITIKADVETETKIHATLQDTYKIIPLCVKELYAFPENVTQGSVIIRLRLLHRQTMEKNVCRIQGFIVNVLETVFNDQTFKTSLPKEIADIEVTVSTTDKDTDANIYSLENSDQRDKYQINLIVVNKAFLIKELDITTLWNAFKSRGHFSDIDLPTDLERRVIAERFVNMLDSQNMFDVLLEILEKEGMSYVMNRLQQSKQAYYSDSPMMEMNIIHSISRLATEIELDELVRTTFIERGVFTENSLNKIEKTFPAKDDQMYVILIDVIKMGHFAMRTLVDILFLSNLGFLAVYILDNTEVYESEMAADHLSDKHMRLQHNTEKVDTVLFTGKYKAELGWAGENKRNAMHGNDLDTKSHHKDDTDSDPTLEHIEIASSQLYMEEKRDNKEDLNSGDNERSLMHANDSDKKSKHTDDTNSNPTFENTETGPPQLSVEKIGADKEVLNSEDNKRGSMHGNDSDTKSKTKYDTDSDPTLETTETGSIQLSMEKTDDCKDVLNTGNGERGSMNRNDSETTSTTKYDTDNDLTLKKTETGSIQLSMEKTDDCKDVLNTEDNERGSMHGNDSDTKSKNKNDTDSDPTLEYNETGSDQLSMETTGDDKEVLNTGDNERGSMHRNDSETKSKTKYDTDSDPTLEKTETGSIQLSMEKTDDCKDVLNTGDIERGSKHGNYLDTKSKNKDDTDSNPTLEKTETGSSQLAMESTGDDKEVLKTMDNKRGSIYLNDANTKSKHKDDTDSEPNLEKTETGSSQLSIEKKGDDKDVLNSVQRTSNELLSCDTSTKQKKFRRRLNRTRAVRLTDDDSKTIRRILGKNTTWKSESNGLCNEYETDSDNERYDDSKDRTVIVKPRKKVTSYAKKVKLRRTCSEGCIIYVNTEGHETDSGIRKTDSRSAETEIEPTVSTTKFAHNSDIPPEALDDEKGELYAMAGYLQLKMSILKGYKTRWFSLHYSGYIQYYAIKPTKPDEQPQGKMFLLLSDVQTNEDHCFRLISACNLKYRLKAKDKEETCKWITAIQCVQMKIYNEIFEGLYDNIETDIFDRTQIKVTNSENQQNSHVEPVAIAGRDKESLHQFNKRKYVAVAGIDFGTTYSGCAFSTSSHFKDDPLKIIPIHLDEDNRSYKTPTVLLLTPEGKFHSFGTQAEEHYVTLAEQDTAKDWYYFDRFKMELCTDEISRTLTSNMDMKEKGGKSMKACNVFAFCIEYMKDKLLQTQQGAIKNLNENDIKWVLTVPAIWNDQARQFMIRAAEKAGITTQSLSLALEPESAAVCCKYIDVAKEESTELKTIDANTKFMVVDMGGGTVDITVSHLLPTGHLKQMHSAIGGSWGGNLINDKILKTLTEVIGSDKVAAFKEEDFDSYLEFEKKIELKKRSYKFDADFKLDIPANIGKSFIINDVYKDKVHNRNGKIFYSKSLMRDIYMSSINPIIDCVDKMLSKKETLGVSTILLVGGYASSTFVQDVFKKQYGKMFDIRIPLTPDMTVLKGAIITGHMTEIIVGRVAKYHYGFALRSKVVSGRRVTIGKEKPKHFCPFIKKGQIINIGHVVNEYEITLDAKAVLAKVDIYTTKDKKPRERIDNKHFSKVGSINVKLPRLKTESVIILIMSYDETEFRVMAKDKQTGKLFLGFCQFLEKDDKMIKDD